MTGTTTGRPARAVRGGAVPGRARRGRVHRGLVHQGLVYGDDEAFLDATVPFCLDGLEQGDAVLAVTTDANIGLLRRALKDAAEDIEFVDADQWYRAPGRTLGAYHRYVDRHAAGDRPRRTRVIGEPVWHGRDALERAEWARYESVINVAFADCPAWIICPYDTRVLPDEVVAGARRTHPQLVTGPAPHASDRYAAPDAAAGPWTRGLAPAPADGGGAALRFGAELAPVRAFVAREAASLGLPGSGVRRLVFAVNEVATNAVQHGAGGRVAVRRSGRRIVCDVTNPGGGDVDWYLGYLPPGPEQQRGHGLWTVRQLCDLVEVVADRGTTTVRVQLSLP
ncbi:sensor histidine kinase [Streptacidiphilus sp. PB12-B1b]|uniref:sensor histidine kinase n=1 Tax=Streptacidiphilus sp. PB12-B1b TaxID=2705012 RepID=UPI0015F837C7|nr:sensor histidine kinase [Streptacidiphilus sp. PB12-B1b]QMU77177.1 sensor histidine kinase [Streptacidiphilus sp. PB12-B1b]